MKEIFDSNDEAAVKLLASSMSKEEFTALVTEWVTENYKAIVNQRYGLTLAERRRGNFRYWNINNALQTVRQFLFGIDITYMNYIAPDQQYLITIIIKHLC